MPAPQAAQAKASAEHAYKVLLAAKRTVMEVDAALHSRQEAMLSGAAATAPDGSPVRAARVFRIEELNPKKPATVFP